MDIELDDPALSGIALAENFGDTDPVPSDKELDEAFEAPDNKTYCIISNNQKVGGAIVKIDRQNRHNFLEFFSFMPDVTVRA